MSQRLSDVAVIGHRGRVEVVLIVARKLVLARIFLENFSRRSRTQSGFSLPCLTSRAARSSKMLEHPAQRVLFARLFCLDPLLEHLEGRGPAHPSELGARYIHGTSRLRFRQKGQGRMWTGWKMNPWCPFWAFQYLLLTRQNRDFGRFRFPDRARRTAEPRLSKART